MDASSFQGWSAAGLELLRRVLAEAKRANRAELVTHWNHFAPPAGAIATTRGDAWASLAPRLSGRVTNYDLHQLSTLQWRADGERFVGSTGSDEIRRDWFAERFAALNDLGITFEATP